jgi:hypothetical protein
MPIYALVDTWNSAGTTFTAVKMNVTDTASAAASLLLDLQVGGTSQFKVSKGGRVTAQTLTIGLGGQTAVATNTALGFEALPGASLTGASNVGVGYRALYTCDTGASNVAIGVNTLYYTTSGAANSAIGQLALFACTSGNDNEAMGFQACTSTTSGNNNIGLGSQALMENVTGSSSTAIGMQAAQRFVSSQNTAIGYRALRGGDATPANNTGQNNIGIGYQAGDAITTGSTNLVIGHDIDVDSPTGSNQINIADRYFHDRIRLLERTSDPAKPAEGNVVIWMSDGTGLGDDGDIMIGSTAGGVTNYGTLFDHSGGTLWP